ncbi:NAD kinase 1, partial [Thecamonas trahens ATCC 50062]
MMRTQSLSAVSSKPRPSSLLSVHSRQVSDSQLPISPRSKAGLRLTRFSGSQQNNVKVDVVPDAQIETAELLSKVRMAWETTPLSVFVVKKWQSPEVSLRAEQLIRILINKYRLTVYVEPVVKSSDYSDWDGVHALPAEGVDVATIVDFVVCLGGDGTLLHSTTFFYKSVPPILSFALGSLGFLTPFSFQRAEKVLNKVLEGGFFLTLRSRLVCSIIEGFALDEHDERKPLAQFQILNDMVVDRGPAASLASLDIFCDHDFITNVQADGIIVATATGSTAYSMSAGGSIVHPGVPCILLTPICPHSVSFRPVALPYSSTIRIRVADNARNTAWASFDGRSRTELLHGQTLQCSVSPWSVPTISKVSETADWLVSLRRNMHWNKRTSQKPMGPVKSSRTQKSKRRAARRHTTSLLSTSPLSTSPPSTSANAYSATFDDDAASDARPHGDGASDNTGPQ